MKRINDSKLINQYIEKYNINEFFSKDIKPYTELFLFSKGDHVCREGESLRHLFFLVEGKAKVYSSLSNGKTILICFYNSGSIIGDVEFMKLEPANSNFQVIEDSYCIAISLERVREYLLDDTKFMQFMCRSLSEKLIRLSKSSSINLLYPLENRLASYILATATSTYINEARAMIFSENLTELANLLGTSYRHLLRTLKMLCKSEILEKKNTYFKIIDLDRLKNLAADLGNGLWEAF
ncbi:transcriptional regulator YeiL [Clostridium sp. CX1]|uniref:Transcriptional regulator YeiL n=1 Tax=Clostridium tanneri TaxID=3037988 RepID=A0ABU4JXW7_9CLOT|nr:MULTISPECIES: transcriptional regulator YeiL [unclassified Clostridium]MCT8975277.1 transcriptional regulator YeiL [Clostridium sp. CX1]MDW8803020.1 transcriptional regulator YeiL [Clostridium sp. A1-XYC3]